MKDSVTPLLPPMKKVLVYRGLIGVEGEKTIDLFQEPPTLTEAS